jgi:formylglycine-generating enzyme required for sulfatase activity
MGQPENVWPLLKHSADPRTRSYIIDRLSLLGADATPIMKQLSVEAEITIRRALILSLGEFSEELLPVAARATLLPKVQAIYRSDADPGLHATLEWLLRQWKQEAWLKRVNEEWGKDKVEREKRLLTIQQHIAKDKEKTPPQWFINSQGQTFAVIPGPVEFIMGSPPTEAGRQESETQHKVRIGRTFALAAKLVTLAEYQRLDPQYGDDIKQWCPTGDCPVLTITWFQAAEYCNWLSKQEGLPESEWCYVPLRDPKAVPVLAVGSVGLVGSSFGPLLAACGAYPGRTAPEYKVGMALAANYLQRGGYRLPTDAEIEYATRAGAVTCRYYGETEELLPKYAWYAKNGRERAWPVATRKPNDLGLFDMHGNLFTWCQERTKAHANSKSGQDESDEEDVLNVNIDGRVMRGGSFGYQASLVRSALRLDMVPTSRALSVGFRPARTLPLGADTTLRPTSTGVGR